MVQKDDNKTLQELQNLLNWYKERCKQLEHENEKLKDKVRAFYGI
jgi:DNA-directed RNA polymerase sigma subunit (sigma70/sigma32)